MTKKIILDCDPGHDDALAMTLAVASPKIELLAVTTSAGNQTPDKTLNNAMRMLKLLGREDIPVAGGNRTPLVKPLETAGEVHGETVCDYYELTGKPQNTEVMLGINRQRFIELIMEALHSFD